MPPIARKLRRGRMTLLARVRRRLQKVSPYVSLILLLVPLLLVEPLKLVAVIVAGGGHWLTGMGMLVAAYAASLLMIERLFRVLKPKLMTIGWFAKLWSGFVALREARSIAGMSDMPDRRPRISLALMRATTLRATAATLPSLDQAHIAIIRSPRPRARRSWAQSQGPALSRS